MAPKPCTITCPLASVACIILKCDIDNKVYWLVVAFGVEQYCGRNWFCTQPLNYTAAAINEIICSCIYNGTTLFTSTVVSCSLNDNLAHFFVRFRATVVSLEDFEARLNQVLVRRHVV